MIDKTNNESLALQYAGIMAGEVIEEAISAGEGSDVAKWTGDRYRAFIEAVVDAFQDRLQGLALRDKERVPF